MEPSELELKQKIKEMEQQKRKVESPANELVTFDTWFHKRKDSIPSRHMKEILFADFSARGLKGAATMEQFDKALALYGVKLK
jgi:hypothetical protein